MPMRADMRHARVIDARRGMRASHGGAAMSACLSLFARAAIDDACCCLMLMPCRCHDYYLMPLRATPPLMPCC